MKEGLIIAKKQPRVLNPIQFNVLAIILVLGLLPFAVALVSNAGTSSNERYESSMRQGSSSEPFPDYYTDTYWIDNGGDNYTSYYFNNQVAHYGNPAVPDEYQYDCAYVVDGACKGYNSTYPPRQFIVGNGYYGYQFNLPTTTALFRQSHYAVADHDVYAGGSGDNRFAWHLESYFVEEIDQGQSIDGLKFWFADSNPVSCTNYAGFTNITFEGRIAFHYENQTRQFVDYTFKKENKLQYENLDLNNGGFTTECAVGFTVNFDFSNFETLSISQFNANDWDNTTLSVYLENFERKDGLNFGGTELPFAGNDNFYIGIEHKQINPNEVGFYVKTGTLVLSLIVLGVGLASTPYWDPFRNFFKGALE